MVYCISLDDEVHIFVLQAVADVHITEFLRINAMEELEARPCERSEVSDFATFAHLEGPAA
jgi:hypothetical protein